MRIFWMNKQLKPFVLDTYFHVEKLTALQILSWQIHVML